MSRASFRDRGRLAWLALRRGLAHLRGRIASHPLARIPFWPGAGERLLIAPQDLRTADPTRASEIYSGRYAFAGKVVICDGRSPFDMQPPSEDWADTLHGFGWLRHLRAAESAITRANARALVEEWIGLHGGYHAIAWQSETLGRRVISWLAQATLILDDADLRFYRRFLRNLVRQVRYLRQTAGRTRDGVPRLQARIALVYASLCMSGQARHLRRDTRNLVYELERQILPDGGHISRNPNALLELLLDLLPLSQTFTARNVSPPSAILNAIDRMMPMLRFFRHADGAFGLFNGMGPTWPELLATILAYDDARGTPVANAPHSGYQRIDAYPSVLLMDTGCPPPIDLSADAHAGCLSFELSSRYQRIVVNCGVPATSRENWRNVARATAAHSTVTFNDTSSCDFLEGSAFRHLFGVPVVGGPTRVAVTREEQDGGVMLRTSHDGYVKRFGIVHCRTLTLAPDGSRLDGEDMFLPPDGEVLPGQALDEFAIRFHLHPSVKASPLADGRSIMLTMPSRDVWHFHTPVDDVKLEESVYLAGPDGPRRTQQIVIAGRARQVPRVDWSFSHASQALPAPRRTRNTEPELPL